MAFHEVDQASRFGRDIVAASRLAHQLKANVDLQVARVTAMDTDAETQGNYGVTSLTRAQLLTTLTNAQTQLNHVSIQALINQIG